MLGCLRQVADGGVAAESSGVDIASWLVAGATIGYVALTAGLLALALFQARRDEVSLITSLSDRWGRAQGDWVRAMLIARGPTDYYNVAAPLETAHYAKLLMDLQEFAGVGLEDPQWHARHQALANRSREYEERAAATIELLAGISLLVLRGRLSPSGAYAVVGPQLVRNGGSLRTLLPDAPQRAPYGEGLAWNLQNWATYRPGVVRRVLILLDLAWAEAARLGDLGPFELATAADVKASGTGQRNRDRLFRQVRRVSPLGLIRAFRLSRLLRNAEWRRRCRRLGLDRTRVVGAQDPWLKGVIPD
ncbi:MAG: hypothetical protein ACT452_21130 [Microthrixaceae bacterium]